MSELRKAGEPLLRILLTGSSGLLGHAVVKQLLLHHRVFAVVRTSPAIPEPNIDYVVCDLTKPLDDSRLPKEIDIVIHLAQSPHYRDFPNQAAHVFQVNCAAMANLLDYAVKANVSHFIYTSTGSVYEPYAGDMTEQTKLDPPSFYANSKWIAERLLRSYEPYFKTTVLRLFFLYGPHPDVKQTLINQLMKRVETGEAITLEGEAGGLEFVPTLTFDIARAIERVIDQGSTGIFNAANPVSLTLEACVTIMGQWMGVTPIFKRQREKRAVRVVPPVEQLLLALPTLQFTSFSEGVRLLCS